MSDGEFAGAIEVVTGAAKGIGRVIDPLSRAHCRNGRRSPKCQKQDYRI